MPVDGNGLTDCREQPAARARIRWTEAQSRERGQDALGAAARYAALGATVTALRLRLSVAPDSATRNTIRDELLAFIRSKSGTGDARTAVEVLDKAFTSFTPAEELIIARSSAASGPPARAVTGIRARADAAEPDHVRRIGWRTRRR